MAEAIKIPQVGESITEVQIAAWQKHEGDAVEKDEPIVTIDSDKATVEISAPASGTLIKILKQDGEEVSVGDVIGEIDTDSQPQPDKDDPAKAEKKEAGRTKSETKPKRKEDGEKEKEKETSEAEARESEEKSGDKSKAEKADRKPERAVKSDRPPLTPDVQALLDEHNLKAEDVKTSGPGGQLIKDDVRRHLEAREKKTDTKPAPTKPTEEPSPEAKEPSEDEAASAEVTRAPAIRHTDKREDEMVRMTPLRRTVAKRLVEAQRTMAMLTTFNEIDMAAVAELRKQFKEAFEKRHGVKLGLMAFFVKATVAALREFPRLNAEVRGEDIVLHHYCDIGVAIGAGKGLVVPAIRNAELLGFAEIEKAIADFAGRARDNKLKPEELEGGTFTISNGGVYGSLLSTPIINPPQSGILGLHAIQDRAVVRDGEIVIRPMMHVALSYDHRIVDGREAVTFLLRIKEFVESPPRLLLEV